MNKKNESNKLFEAVFQIHKMEAILFQKIKDSHYSRLILAVNQLVTETNVSRLQILKVFSTAFNSKIGLFLHKVLSNLATDSETLQQDMWILMGEKKVNIEEIASSIQSLIDWRSDNLSVVLWDYSEIVDDNDFDESTFLDFLKRTNHPSLEIFLRGIQNN